MGSRLERNHMELKLDFEVIRKELEVQKWETYPYCAEQKFRSVYIGTVFSLLPSGKYYTCFANSNVSEEDAQRDEKWYELVDLKLSEFDAYIQHGDGDPCDLFVEQITSNFVDPGPNWDLF